MDQWIVGIDLGGTKMALGLIDPDGQIATRRRLQTDADAGPADVVERIAQSVADLARELPHGARIAVLGICCPGPVDHEAGTPIDPPNIKGLHHAPLRQMLSERLGLPACLEHDAKAAALGEFHHGAGRGEQNMVYIVVGTGVGAAIMIDGHLYRGACDAAGEVGHITLDRHGALCSCGSRGCVETYVSGPWLARRYQRAIEESGPVQGLEDGRAFDGADVTRLAGEGDVLAARIVAQGGEALGVAVASMAMVLDIQLYVVGGGVARAGDLLLEPARRTVPECSYPSVCRRVRIVGSELGDDGPILGCGWLARQLLQSGD